MKQERFGTLDVVLAGGSDREGGGDGPLVVLLHGFGAPATDLVGLWRVLDVPQGTRFAFPGAPVDLGFGGRAWWPLDIPAIERAIAEGRHRDLTEAHPEGLDDARAQLTACLDDMASSLGPSKTILGGFSQGSMLALDFALHDRRKLDAVVLLSGTLLNEQAWVELMPQRRGLPVFQSHGRRDPILSFEIASRLRDQLSSAGIAHEWMEFGGGHEIPPDVLARLGAFIRRAFSDG